MAERAYQQRFLEQHAAATLAGHKSVMLVLPVGAGKTYTARLVVERIAPKRRHDIWVLEHRNELGFQFAEAFTGLDAVLLQAGQKNPPPTQIRIAGRDTLARRDIVPLYDCCLLIIDEAHIGVCASYQKLIARFKAVYRVVYVLLLTATPYRLDGKELGEVADTLIEPVTPEQLFDAGIIWEPQVIGAATPELGGVPMLGGEYDSGVLAERSKKLIGDVVKEAEKWTEGYPFVVRCTTIEHSRSVAERLCAASFRARHLDGTTLLAERNELLARLSIGGKLGHSTGIDCICVSKGGLLAEGWNPESDYKRLLLLPELWATPEQLASVGVQPNAEALALALIQSGVLPPRYMPVSVLSDCAPTMSKCLYRQFEGRVCRPCGDSIRVQLCSVWLVFVALRKTFARIISHSGNWQRHGFLRNHFGFSLHKPKGKQRPGMTPLEGARYCSVCLSIWPSGRSVCSCGAALSIPKPPPEDTKEELKIVPLGAQPQASKRQVVEYLKNLWLWWAKENEKRRALGKEPAKEAQVRSVYRSRSGRWPTNEDLEEARRLAFPPKDD